MGTEVIVKQVLTADDLAARWGRSRYSIYEMVKRRELPALKIGRSVRFRLVDIEKWEAKRVQRNTKEES
jgi:putative molybdopterin biosynthesis protein